MSRFTSFTNIVQKGLLPLAVMLLVLGLTVPAMAVSTTFGVTGIVDFVDPALSGTFSNGDTMTLLYTFESTTPARAGSTSTAAVFDPLTSLSLTIGSYTASSNGAPEIQIDNDLPGFNDRYSLVSRASDGLSGPTVAGNSVNFFFFRLDDSTDTAFNDALILPTSLSLADFDNNLPSRLFSLEFTDSSFPSGPTLSVSGKVTGLAAPIPEPGTFLLFGTGLAGLAAWRLRKRAE